MNKIKLLALIILFFACNEPMQKTKLTATQTVDQYHDVFWAMNDTTTVSVVVEWHLNRIRIIFKQGNRRDTNYTNRSDKYLHK